MEMFLPDRKRTRSKDRLKTQTSSGVAAKTAVILFLLVVSVSAFASPSKALREYQAGKYQDALKDYENSLQKKTGDSRLHFNAGAAAYQTQQYDKLPNNSAIL